MENPIANHAHLGEFDYPLVRSTLRAWLALEDFYIDILEAAEKGDREIFVSSVYSYVSAALFITEDDLKSCQWNEVTRAFREIRNINQPNYNFPILRQSSKREITKDGWEYRGRTWYFWLHVIAKEYGWKSEEIENLSIDDGIAILQEILIDKQLSKEWEWSMSQIAYPYDEHTKTSKFVPLERPDWMKEIPKEIKKVRIRASELPIGLVLKWDTDNNVYTRPQ